MRRTILAVTFVWASSFIALSGQQAAHPSLIRNHQAIAYASAPVTDPVARLNAKLASGEVKLVPDGPSGYLHSVLDALGVPVSSQVLVFSKTSFQAPRIGPNNPRAIFFNDTVSVGWVRTGPVLELVAHDPKQGAIFYTMPNPTAQPTHGGAPEREPTATPQFERNDTCTMCHVADATHNVPGMLVGSVFPGADGTTLYGPAYTTDHRSPFEMRWGGWFVTGTHQATRHMGNATATNPSDLESMITPATVHVTDLKGRFNMDGYLSPHSDIVALLVLEHQAQMLNLVTRVGWEARIGADAGRPLERAAAEFVDYMLFVDEAPLPGPIAGTSAFASTFPAAGPRDRRGRSLRDLDLGKRLLRYPCSYLIYSEPFDALPATAKAAVYERLWEVLSGRDNAPRYNVLSSADRTAIVEILRDTKKDLPTYWFAGS
jgi:hypothetical protein